MEWNRSVDTLLALSLAHAALTFYPSTRQGMGQTYSIKSVSFVKRHFVGQIFSQILPHLHKDQNKLKEYRMEIIMHRKREVKY